MLELGTSWGYWVQPFYDVKCRSTWKGPLVAALWLPSLVAFSIAWGGYPCCHRQRPHGLRLWNPKGSLSSHHLHACLYQGESPTWKVKACVATGVSNLLMICDFLQYIKRLDRCKERPWQRYTKIILFVRQNLCFCWCLPGMGLRSIICLHLWLLHWWFACFRWQWWSCEFDSFDFCRWKLMLRDHSCRRVHGLKTC